MTVDTPVLDSRLRENDGVARTTAWLMPEYLREVGGVEQRANAKIVILVSSIRHVHKVGLRYPFTDSHAYYQYTNFYADLADLDKIDWPLLQRRDFKRDPDDPAKFERYQAEALIHQHLPMAGLLGIVCYTEALKQRIELEIHARNLNLPVYARTGWYF